MISRARTWVSCSLDLSIESPCAEVWRAVNLLAVVPLEVGVHSVKALELNEKLVSAKFVVFLMVIKSKLLTSFMARFSQPLLYMVSRTATPFQTTKVLILLSTVRPSSSSQSLQPQLTPLVGTASPVHLVKAVSMESATPSQFFLTLPYEPRYTPNNLTPF